MASDIIQEQWKDITGYEGYYQVSDLGNVRSIDRYVLHKNGTLMPIKGRLLRGAIAKNGYIQIILCVECVKKNLMVHRVVGKHFLRPQDSKSQINHINGIKTDNRAENLEWCTPSENIKHAYRNGMVGLVKPKGLDNKNSKPIKGVDSNGNTILFDSITQAANMLPNDASNIVKCLKGKQKSASGYKWEYI